MLLVDVGNTRLKWKLQGEHSTFSIAVPYNVTNFSSLLDQYWKKLEPQAVCISSVVDKALNKKLITWFKKHHFPEPQFARTEKYAMGVTNAYEDYETLGVDRWLALLAAWHKVQKAVCVIDAGTGVTVDFIDSEGNHRGGVILPGFQAMQQALTARTNLKLNTLSKQSVDLASSTQDAISRGCLLSVLGGVEKLLNNMALEYGDFDCIVAGGDASIICDSLPVDAILYKDIVLDGLALLAK